MSLLLLFHENGPATQAGVDGVFGFWLGGISAPNQSTTVFRVVRAAGDPMFQFAQIVGGTP